MDKIFIAEAAAICKVDTRTFNNFVKKNVIRVVDITPSGFRRFDRKEVEQLAKRIPKKRKKGHAIIYQMD